MRVLMLLGILLGVTPEVLAQQDPGARPIEPWGSVHGELRLRWEGRTGEQFHPARRDGYLLTRVRATIDVRPTRWLRLLLEGQDAQALGLRADPDPPLFEDTFDLRQAYVEVFDRGHQGWGVRVGRQEFIFGDERLIGAFSWGNTARTFDAVRLFYAASAWRVDLWASSVVVIEDGAFNRHRDGENFYGVYGSFRSLVPKAVVEGYMLWRTLPRVLSERGAAGDADIYTAGTRWVGALPAGFDYRGEVAGQWGHRVRDRVRAWAMHAQLGYTARGMPMSPRFLIEFNRASGDRDPADGRRETFDQLYPTNHDKYGIADLVGWQNMRNLRVGVGMKLTSRVSGQLDYHSFWLESRRDALYAAGGIPIARVVSGARHRHIGHEVDVDFRVTVTRALAFWAGYARFVSGGFLREATPGASAAFAYAMLIYRF